MIGALLAVAVELAAAWVVTRPEPSGRHHAARALHAPRLRHHGHHIKQEVVRQAVAS